MESPFRLLSRWTLRSFGAVLTIFLIIIPTTCRSSEPWTQADIARQVVFTGLVAADWAQTRAIATNPCYYEMMNPALGHHPNIAALNRIFLADVALNPLIAHLLPHPYRQGWQNA